MFCCSLIFPEVHVTSGLQGDGATVTREFCMFYTAHSRWHSLPFPQKVWFLLNNLARETEKELKRVL